MNVNFNNLESNIILYINKRGQAENKEADALIPKIKNILDQFKKHIQEDLKNIHHLVDSLEFQILNPEQSSLDAIHRSVSQLKWFVISATREEIRNKLGKFIAPMEQCSTLFNTLLNLAIDYSAANRQLGNPEGELLHKEQEDLKQKKESLNRIHNRIFEILQSFANTKEMIRAMGFFNSPEEYENAKQDYFRSVHGILFETRMVIEKASAGILNLDLDINYNIDSALESWGNTRLYQTLYLPFSV